MAIADQKTLRLSELKLGTSIMINKLKNFDI